jgi:hypothetical protein
MGWGVLTSVRFRIPAFVATWTAIAAVGTSGAAFAQTSQVLSAPNTQVIDTMIRNGAYATFNHDGPLLLTRFSTVADWERRTIFAYETTSIPQGSIVSSAILTLTVKSGLGLVGETRPVTAYRLTAGFIETQASWRDRQSLVPWQTPGGDLGESYTTAAVSNVAGTKVSFDVTALVQRTVSGNFGSRQTRLALVDVGGGDNAKESYREYHASESSSTGSRPKLTVVYGPPTDPAVIDVPAGGDLQQALNQVQPGGTVRLASGATFVGNFTLPAKGGNTFVVLTTNAPLPPAGTRIDPSYRAGLATIRSPNESPALSTVAGASYYRIVGVAFRANVNGAGDIIALGDHTQTTLAQVPHHLEFDRVLIEGDAAVGQKRGIAANAAHIVISNSDIREIKAVGQDSQAIAGWNTPGPITIRNNYLEAAGENVMFGGAQINIPGAVPSDIVVEDNLMTKNLLWRGSSWTVKNIFELKNARRVRIHGNILEHNWVAAQTGYAVVFTPRNSSGQNPWVVIEDVEFSGNVLRRSSAGFNLLGYDNTAQSGQLARVRITDNLVYEIGAPIVGGGSGIFAQIGGEPRDITFDHNTVLQTGHIMSLYSGSYINASGVRVTGGPILGLVFTNHLIKHNAYGIFGSGQAYGNGSLNFYAPGAIVRRNVMASDKSVAWRYPADNQFPTVAVFMANFLNPSIHDYRLVTSSAHLDAGLDGLDLGCTLVVVLMAGII